jgi:RNA polymerase sigma-70 factor (ECF subfamily)
MTNLPTTKDYRDVLAFVRRRVRSAEDAEDLTQQVFEEMAAALERSTLSSPPTIGWLYTVAQRRIIDESRRRSRRRTVALEVVPDPGIASSPYGSAVTAAFDDALSRLDEVQRGLLVGRLIQGRSFRDLATDLSLSEEAARMRFMRGLRSVRSSFEEKGLTP